MMIEQCKPRRKYRQRKPSRLHPMRQTFRRLYPSRAFTLRYLSLRLGVSVSTLNNWRRVDFPDGSKSMWLEFVGLYELDQYTPAEIAESLETTPYTVYRFRCRYAKKWPGRAEHRAGG